MKAWILDRAARRFTFDDIKPPEVVRDSVLVAIKAVPLLSYMREYLSGERRYLPPSQPFTPGTNGVGVISAVGPGVHHLRVGQHVAVSPYFVSHENVPDPSQALIGLTALAAEGDGVLSDWPDGTLRQLALMPAITVVPLDGLEHIPFERLAALGKFAVPFGGLVRGRLTAGETLIVNGASGYFGSAAAFLGVALGAARVVVTGRRGLSLAAVAEQAGPRVSPLTLTGDVENDTKALRDETEGGAEVALDLVGQAADPNSTLAALGALRRGGRLILMGSMTVPLPLPYGDIVRNDWEIAGQLMYTPADYRRLVQLVRIGAVDLGVVNVMTFPAADLLPAIEQAADMRALDCTVMTF